MIYWCLFSGYILIVSVLVKSDQTALDCSTGKTIDGLKLSICQRPPNAEEHTELILSSNIPYDIEALEVRDGLRFSVDENTLSKFGDLKRISLVHVYFVDRNWVTKSQEWYESIYKNLFANTMAEEITLVGCFLQDENAFKYPSTIRMLNLSRNSYTVLDLREYEEIESVNMRLNDLENVPMFSDPAPPLSYLNMASNPLKNITVHDIAALCWLKTLEMAAGYSDLSTLRRKCECDRIFSWSDEVKLKMPGFECHRTSEQDLKSLNCSSYTLDGARKIRQQCIKSNTGILFVLRKIKKHKFKILTVILVLFLSGVFVYLGYKCYNGTLTKATWKRKESKPTATTAAAAAAATEEVDEEEEKTDTG